MIEFLSSINWNVSPEIFSIGPITVRWYGLLFASAFLVGQQLMYKMYSMEGKPKSDVDTLTIYMIIATVVGARLGHCLFYQPEYYLEKPIRILWIHQGGLASHGAAIGILLGAWIYSRKKADQSFLWVIDKVVVVVALAGFFIRLGNFMNSEILGIPTDLPWGVIFERVDFQPRHPAQLYESISSLILFFILWFVVKTKKEKTPQGSLLGIFLIWIFGLRFFYEFLKENQVDFESTLPLNMGQILSIPLFIGGCILLAYSMRKKVS